MLNKKEFEKIRDLLRSMEHDMCWPITLTQTDSNGIGYCTYLEMGLNVNEVNGHFKITVSDHRDW